MGHFISVLCVFLVFSSVLGCCPNGWIRYDDSCYIIEDELVDWHTAHNRCDTLYGHLAKPQTPRENNFLRQLLMKTFPSYAASTATTYLWIGGNDIAVENDWVWEGNGGSISYFDWGAGEPNNARAANCLMYHGAEKFHWNDAPCDMKVRYICELEDVTETVVG